MLSFSFTPAYATEQRDNHKIIAWVKRTYAPVKGNDTQSGGFLTGGDKI